MTHIEGLRNTVSLAQSEADNAQKILSMRTNRLAAARLALAEACAVYKPGDILSGFGGKFATGVVISVVAPDPANVEAVVAAGAERHEHSYAMRGIKKDGTAANVAISELRILSAIPTMKKIGEMPVPTEEEAAS